MTTSPDQRPRDGAATEPTWHHSPDAPPEHFCEDCDALLRENRRLRTFANWAAQLDDPSNPEHRTIRLYDIAERAQRTVGPS